MRLCWFIFFLSLIFSQGIWGQAVVGEVKLKKYSTDGFELYPYDYLDPYGRSIYVLHDPSFKASEGEVVQIWQPERGSYRDRIMRKYNILMELMWETEIELERDEEILHFYQTDTTIVLLTSKSERSIDRYSVVAHKFGLESGKLFATNVWWMINSTDDHGLQFHLAKDQSRMLLYHFVHEKEHRNVSLYYDYIRRDDQAGYRATGVHRAHFVVLGKDGSKLSEGFLEPGNPKMTVLDCQTDRENNVYLTAYEKPEKIKVLQWNAQTKEQRELTYEVGIPFHELLDSYTTHLPPTIGLGEKVYLSFSERVKRGKAKGTKGFDIVCFDFMTYEVDTRRHLSINSTLQVLVEKQREEFGLKPVPRFDEFMIRDIVEMADSSLWLITQKYHSQSAPGANYASPDIGPADLKTEELILYEFGLEGKPKQAIVIPTIQYVQSMAERVSQFYHLEIDEQTRTARLITREPSGDKLRGPERIYFRRIDLNTREVTDRIQIYHGKRRDQYLLRAFIDWLNPAIVSFLVIDGDSGNAYSIAVNVEMEPVEEEEESGSRRKRNARKK
ncbi:MAG: hypothetical protein AAF587_00935 [Bacteroidota bacterium]